MAFLSPFPKYHVDSLMVILGFILCGIICTSLACEFLKSQISMPRDSSSFTSVVPLYKPKGMIHRVDQIFINII